MKRVTAVTLAVVLVAAACGATSSSTSSGAASSNAPVWRPHTPSTPHPPSPAHPGKSPKQAACRTVVVAAGDIVNDTGIANQTGRVAAVEHPDLVLLLGDNQYPAGALADYQNRYDHTAWARLKPITNPVPGNHEYRTRDADGYFTYFDHPPPYYAFDTGCGWRGYALNSEIDLAPQLTWLHRDLAAHPTAAVLAYWHRPRWSSGTEHGSNPSMQPLWTALAGRTGIVLNGHEHNFERFAPNEGLREIVVGTGGTSTYPFGAPAPGSQQRIARTPGILRLDLNSHAAYHWAFLNTNGDAIDHGSG